MHVMTNALLLRSHRDYKCRKKQFIQGIIRSKVFGNEMFSIKRDSKTCFNLLPKWFQIWIERIERTRQGQRATSMRRLSSSAPPIRSNGWDGDRLYQQAPGEKKAQMCERKEGSRQTKQRQKNHMRVVWWHPAVCVRDLEPECCFGAWIELSGWLGGWLEGLVSQQINDRDIN